jgi:hypothetical protein
VIATNPTVPRQAVDRYLTLVAQGDPAGLPLQNTVYTLCVLTGTRTVEEAMTAVRRLCIERPTPGPSHRQAFTVPPDRSGSAEGKALS